MTELTALPPPLARSWFASPASLAITVLTVLFALVVIGGLAIGPYPISVSDMLASLLGEGTRQAKSILAIRAPRVALAVAAGGGLAVAGAALQALFRNPLADPGLTGITGGAAFAAVAVIAFQDALLGPLPASYGLFLLPLAAFAGGLAAVSLCYWAARTPDGISMPIMLLAGIAIGTISGAGLGVVIYLADDSQLRSISFWTLGSLGGASWLPILFSLPPVIAGSLYLLARARELDALALGEAEAFGLGVDTRALKGRIILVAAMVTGAVICLVGMIGFIGLVAPHVARLLVGASNRLVLPASILFGATLLVSADTAARTIAAPAEIPVGILTSIVGGPLFLWLVVRNHGR
ncbi:MAG: iron ABC transporter permease [Hyphomicrobiales bacterium]|nr:iron ABC transporter permease [Hyphomicrobiales bacterium]